MPPYPLSNAEWGWWLVLVSSVVVEVLPKKQKSFFHLIWFCPQKCFYTKEVKRTSPELAGTGSVKRVCWMPACSVRNPYFVVLTIDYEKHRVCGLDKIAFLPARNQGRT